MKSIMTNDMKTCYLCGSTSWIEIHHVMNGPSRKKSEKYGLVVPLCHYCHNEPGGVHYDQEKDNALKAEAQRKFEELHGEGTWVKEFHKNYNF